MRALSILLPMGQTRWSRLGKWLSPLLIALLFLGMFGVVLQLNRLESSTSETGGPKESYHWHVSQYHVAFLKMAEELRVEARGGEISKLEHETKAATLGAKAAELTQLAESRFFQEVKGFEEAVQQINAFHARDDRASG